MGACDGCNDCAMQVLFQILGIEVTMVLFVLPVIYSIFHSEEIGQEGPAYYLIRLCHHGIWLMYAIFSLNWGGIFVNVIGVVAHLYYLGVLISNSASSNRWKISAVLAGISLVVALIGVIVFGLLGSRQASALGLLGCCTGLIMYSVSCYHAIYALLAGTVSENTNLVPVLASLVNGLLWIAYAALRDDHFIMILNLVCIVSALVQLGTYAWFYGKAWIVIGRVYKVLPAKKPLLA